ncbi:glutathione S-transferase [Labrenzia sp. OB1]|uniref:glutathione S-transferase n=1 Tax=Labrenzia sp. OB1 TaxID=1561204 RepID=UPI0007B1F78C|nr:glutathione S-transferase [Labrenzia sp. OB1]KZM47773.1 glutathione S-transferase [Labrenzia sp. OB1]
MPEHPILYSFRRCPYAIRARLAILVSGQTVEIREIVLREKAPEFLETSPSATVPCLKHGDAVVDESLDIMLWALERNDPEDWLRTGGADLDAALELIRACDGPFKKHLDRYKYDTRHPDADRDHERQAGAVFLTHLNDALSRDGCWLLGPRASIADYAILPFVRQFANTDRTWFDSQDWSALLLWLEAFERSEPYLAVMRKWPRWCNGDAPVLFPA